MLGFNAISESALSANTAEQALIELRYSYIDSLLPSNATTQEKDLELSLTRFADIDFPIRYLMDADKCPLSHLPWLAWALSVDEWQPTWPEERKRETIKNSLIVHAKKGTVDSIRRVIRYAGYGEVNIQEGRIGTVYDGSDQYGGTQQYNASGHWADYRIYLQKPISNEEAESLRRILKNTAPARCKLVELNYTESQFKYNAEINYDGTYSYGSN